MHARTSLLRDTPERIDFHVQTGDYFAVLATALGFMQEALERCPEGERERQLAEELRKDLRYMNGKYSIHPKNARKG